LAQPLLDCARDALEAGACEDYALVVLDWCPLHFNGHHARKDRVALGRRQDRGYNLLSALLVSDRQGQPIAPLCLEVRASNGIHSTRSDQTLKALSRLDGLTPLLADAANVLTGSKPLLKPVYIIDAEADSVGHYRKWQADGRLLLVRADLNRRVLENDKERKLDEVLRRMKTSGKLKPVGTVLYKGKLVRPFVGETLVVLHRPARQHRVIRGKYKYRKIPGPALPMRLIVSELREEHGKVLAQWLLLSNCPDSVSAATLAKWYYWRWRIESFHKLLKEAGQHIEQWQQETAAALSRRLIVAAMAAVVVWQLARNNSPQAQDFRQLLVQLSGRQMKRTREARDFTEPALMAGMGILIPMLHLLQHYDLSKIQRLAKAVLPQLLPQAIDSG
jgi:Transposase DDE domain